MAKETKKMTYFELYKLLEEDNKNGFYDCYRTHITKKDNDNANDNDNAKKVYGTMYKICNTLTDNVKEKILEYSNTLLYISQCQYAPEIKHNSILVLDKKIR